MEFWPENQGQSPLYPRFGTIPGRNCAHSYHETPQTSHYPLYFSGQQHQARDSSYWTLPGSRAGAQQENTTWTDQDLTDLTASRFPFILDPQQHQDFGEYQLQAARDRHWTAGHQAARDYERGYLREGWQRSWEPCGPVRYNREVLTKRNDNSHRELEAWAARYSHSLPRRKRIEAELRGASQGLGQSRATERDSCRSGTDPRVAALQHVIQSANLKESALWERGARQQTLTHYQCPTSATDTSHMMDVKDKIRYQRRMFSHPPGYIAPPPYNSPHKRSPELQHCDTSLEKKGKGQTYWSQPTLRDQDVSFAPLAEGEVEKDFIKPDGYQKIFYEPKETKKTDALQTIDRDRIQPTNLQHEGMFPVQKTQVLQEVQNKKINEDRSSKVIEGRKFRLNKKTGGMTIFCLVSRIAGTAETPSLPLCTGTLQENTDNTESGKVCNYLSDRGNKLPDEVDFRACPLTNKPDSPDLKNIQAEQMETPTGEESETLEEIVQKSETGVSPESVETNIDSAFGKSVKYPLWREPSLTNRAETESSSSCLKAKEGEGESDVLHNKNDSINIQPIDIEVRRLNIMKAEASEDSNDLLVIDTTCVLVKMELIPSPKKEHVHYLHSIPHNEDNTLEIPLCSSPEDAQTNRQTNQDMTTDQANPQSLDDGFKVKLDSDYSEEKEPEAERKTTLTCTLPSSVPEGETLAERAERILGIPLQISITEQELKDHIHESIVANQKFEPFLNEDNTFNAVELSEEYTKEGELSQNQAQVGLTEVTIRLQEENEAKDQPVEGSGEEFVNPQEQLSFKPEEDEICPELREDINHSDKMEIVGDPQPECASEEETPEKNQKEDLTDQKDIFIQHLELNSLYSEERLTPSTETKSLIPTPSDKLPSPLLSTDFPQSPTPYGDLPFTTPALDSIFQPAEEFSSCVWEQEEEDEHTKSIKTEISDIFDNLSKDIREEQVSVESFKSCQQHNSSHLTDTTDEQQTEEADEDSAELTEENDEVNILLQKSENSQEENSKDNYTTEKQIPKEVSEHIMNHIVGETFETMKEPATEVITSQQIECFQAEYIACVTECFMNEEQLPKEVTEDLLGDLLQTIESTKNFQTQIEIRNVQDIEALTDIPSSSTTRLSDSKIEETLSREDVLLPSELPSTPDASNKADRELVSLQGEESACPSALDPDAGAASVTDKLEIVPSSFHPDFSKQSINLSSSSVLPTTQLHGSSSPTQEGSRSGSPDSLPAEQPQYPRSLWDAVNRIRRHTAPDSENEEEEFSELWDPESAGEDLSCPEVVENMKSKKMFPHLQGQLDFTGESFEEDGWGQIQPLPEMSRHAEEDTLSCSSTSSHNSGDTVVVADEEEVYESLSHAGADIMEEEYRQGQKTEGTQQFARKVETPTERNDGEERMNESTKMEDGLMQVENIQTNAVEIFTPSEVAVSNFEVTGN